jgi:hypothetical protein
MATTLDAGTPARSKVLAGRENFAIGLVSCLIAGVLGLQVFASFVDPGRWGWPFIAYPMYKTAHFEGERVRYEFEVYVVHEDSSENLLSSDGIPWWIFKRKMVNSLMKGQRDNVQPLVTAYCEKTGKQVAALRLQDMGVALARDGLVYGLEPEILATMTMSCPE